MRISVWPSASRPFTEISEISSYADATGWNTIYVADHFMPNNSDNSPASGDVLECFAALAALASSTTNIRLGSLVAGNLYRHPAVLANSAATIDQISGGRFVLGMGAGWQRNEHDAYGIDLRSVKARLDAFSESMEVISSLLRNERTTFHGDHYEITDAPCAPKPVRWLPLLVGGKGEKRTMQIAAKFADEWNGWCTPDHLVQKSAVLDRHCEALSRDPKTIRRSTQAFLIPHDPSKEGDRTANSGSANATEDGRPQIVGSDGAVTEQIAAFAEAGAYELVIPDWNLGSPSQAIEHLSRFRECAVSAEVEMAK